MKQEQQETIITPEPPQIPAPLSIQPQPQAAPEITLTDGQTEQIPELNSQQPEQGADFLPPYSQTTNDQFYSQAEFQKNFADFLDFLKNPATATDAFETLRAEGQELAANKVYDMARRYRFLNWIIDRRTRLFHDFILLSIFAATETNAIVMNWTGISLFEKGKIWLRSKIKQKQQQAAASNRRSVWGFLGRQAAEKRPKPEN